MNLEYAQALNMEISCVSVVIRMGLAIVSHVAENGNLTTYLERNDATLTLVRRIQIVDAWT
jgi:hypothetical protein